jgi:hypothetical protein
MSLAAATLLAAATGAAPAVARSGDSGCSENAYTMSVGALTGRTQTDVTLQFAAAPGCAPVTAAKHVQIKTFTEAGKVADVLNLHDVALESSTVPVELPRVERGRRIEVQANAETPPKTNVVRGVATALLRPDLTVASVDAPLQTLTTHPVDVSAVIAEVNGDTGATAHVTLAGQIGPLADPVEVTVPPGGHVTVTFPNVPLTTPVPTELKVVVSDVAPGEYDTTNDLRSATVDVTKNAVARSTVLVDSLGGYGFQFNHHLYAPITNVPPETLPDLESKVKALEPQLVRIFYSENWEANSDGRHPEWPANLESFRKVVQLANDSGATIVIAYQGVSAAKLDPVKWMTRFADVLDDLVRNRGLTNVRWITIGNEPNGGAMNLTQYEALTRAISAQLVARGLRSQIGILGGDLVQNTEGTAAGHRAWFSYMIEHMNDVIDAWSEHIYWWYDKPFRMEERLKDVAYLVRQEIPESARKPTFIMEYGVRGYDNCGTKPTLKVAYYLPDCSDLRRMPLGAFHRLWFAIDSAQLGFDGTASWDLYWSTYDFTKANQSQWTIGPPEEGWALYPTYYAFQLLLQTTARGWHVLGTEPWTADDAATRFDDPHPDQPEQEVTAYSGPDGQMTVVGLDTNGRSLIAPNGESSSYSIGGLPPNATFNLALWNADGEGKNSVAGTIVANAAGVARFDVPLQAAFFLTTVPVS